MAKRKQEPQPLVIEAAFGGWVRAIWHGELVAYVRFAPLDEHGLSWRVAALLVDEASVRRYRDVPLARIESAVNADALVKFDLFQHLDKSMGDDVPSAFAMKDSIKVGMSPRQKLERPGTRRLDDDFYASVARAYADAVAWGFNPRKQLALDSETPADTVARWIRTARRKGYLSAGEPGEASGVATSEGSTDG
jgi:hypothetical protein